MRSIRPFIFGIVALATLGSARVAFALCVSVEQANLRTGPGAKHPVSWTVGRYMPLVSLSKNGAWYEVEDMDGEKHWVHQSSVSSSLQCLAVKSRSANLRVGPGAQHALAEYRQIDRYTPLRRYELESGWYKVLAPDGQHYWIHESATWRPTKVMNINF